MFYAVQARASQFTSDPSYRAEVTEKAERMSMWFDGKIVTVEGERGEILMSVAFEELDLDVECEEAS